MPFLKRLMFVVVSVGLIWAHRPWRSWSADGALTLEDALALMRLNNPQLAALHAELAGSRADLLAARRLVPSPLEMEAGLEDATLTGDAHERAWEIAASQEVEVAGQRSLRVREAEARLKAAQARYDTGFLDLSSELYTLFSRARILQERIETRGEIVRLKREVASSARNRVREGYLAEINLKLLEIDLADSQAELLRLEQEQRSALLELARAVGRTDLGNITLKGGNRFALPDADKAALLKKGIDRQPSIVEAGFERDAARVGLTAATRARWPNPSFRLGYSRDTSFGGQDDFRFAPGFDGAVTEFRDTDQLLAVGVRVPIPAFYQNQGEIARARAEVDGAEATVLERRLAVEARLLDSYNRYTQAQYAMGLYEPFTQSFAEDLRAVLSAYQGGRISVDQYLTESDRLIGAREAYLEAISESNSSAIEIARWAGEAPRMIPEGSAP